MPSRRQLRHRTDVSRRRRVAFFILPLGAEAPEDESMDYTGRVWHERAPNDLDVVPLDAPPPPDPLQLDLPLA